MIFTQTILLCIKFKKGESAFTYFFAGCHDLGSPEEMLYYIPSWRFERVFFLEVRLALSFWTSLKASMRLLFIFVAFCDCDCYMSCILTSLSNYSLPCYAAYEARHYYLASPKAHSLNFVWMVIYMNSSQFQ